MIDRPATVPETIVETDTVALAREVAQLAVSLQFPMHIVGAPGTGKSSALWHIARQMGGIYCEVSQTSKGTKGLYELLLQSIGRWDRERQSSELFRNVLHYYSPLEELKSGGWTKSPRFLVVDEVQTLEPATFRELLHIQERCELGLVVAGNAERLAQTSKKDAATWAQIESRIALRRILPGPSRRDCDLIGSTVDCH